jgi:hypothetical protein
MVAVGALTRVDPIPDGPRQPALYWAYDDCDSFYVEAPEFSWVELRGIGTRLSLSDDQTVTISLPSGFGPFVYYGQSYTQLSICSNGWVAPGQTSTTTYNNTALPNTSMPPALFINWDDIYPPQGGGVWYFHDAANNRFIVEWDSVRYYSGTVYDKYEIILYDTTLAAADGNCEFAFQYLVADGLVSSTVGEQDPTATIAIQALFNGSYHRAASYIVAGRAVKFTTDSVLAAIGEGRLAGGERRLSLSAVPSLVRRSALVRFSLPQAGRVRLAVYDLSGRQVRMLAGGECDRGDHVVKWDRRDDSGRTTAAGVYVLRLETAGRTLSRKAVVVE